MSACLLGLLFCLASATVHAQSEGTAQYTEIFYASGNLRIQAYLYRPGGDGPFAVVIYNHGSRIGRERVSVPFEHIGRMLTRVGYVVLVPERRGYGRSDGDEVGARYAGLVAQLQAETDDVLAAIDYLRTLAFVDTKRIGIMGWPFGGIITMFALSRSNAFAVGINQAGGALSWEGNARLRSALVAAADKATTPTLFLVAKNDRTTSSITTLADIFKNRSMRYRLVIYDPVYAARRRLGRCTRARAVRGAGSKRMGR